MGKAKQQPQKPQHSRAQQSPSPDRKPSENCPREIPRKQSNQPAFLQKSIVK